MITFKQYLEEAGKKNVQQKWIQKPLKLDAAVSMIEKNCADSLAAFLKGDGIFRGFSGTTLGAASYIDSSDSFRTSKDSNNLYQLAHDASVHSMHIPSRSNSLICSTDHGTADSFSHGAAYAIFPYDGTQVAISDSADFFAQKIKSTLFDSDDSVTGVTDYLTEVMNAFGFKDSKFDDLDALDARLAAIEANKFAFLAAIHVPKLDYNIRRHVIIGKTPKGQKLSQNALDSYRYDYVANHGGQADMMRREIFELVKSGDYAYKKEFAKFFNIFAGLNSKKRFTGMAALIFTAVAPGGKVVSAGGAALKARDKECWFSGECIAISMDTKNLLQMKKILNAKGYKKTGDHLDVDDFVSRHK